MAERDESENQVSKFRKSPQYVVPVSVSIELPSGDKRESNGNIFGLSPYYPVTDPSHDTNSRSILDLKAANASDTVVAHFAHLVLEHLVDDCTGILCVVPGHSMGIAGGGIVAVARRILVERRPRIEDGIGVLKRTQAVAKLASGGPRELEVHLASVEVSYADRIVGRDVILLDDVMTSGNSMLACGRLLLEAGAARITAIALARTTRTF